MALKPSVVVEAAGDGGHPGHVATDGGPGTEWHRVAVPGNVQQPVAMIGNHWQRDGTTGLRTRPTCQGLEMVEMVEMVEKGGNGGKKNE